MGSAFKTNVAKIANFVVVITLLIMTTEQASFPCVLDGMQKIFECRRQAFKNIEMDIPWSVAISTRISFVGMDFSFNEFEIVKNIPKIKTQVLSFAHNWIRRVEERAFWNLSNLVRLDLSNNQLVHTELLQHQVESPIVYNGTEFEENSPHRLRNLTTLLLSHNFLQKILPRTFSIMPGLTTLDLSWNYIKMLDEDTYEALSSLKYLKTLDLRHNNMESFDKPLLQELHHLTELNLGGNKLVVLPATLSDSHLQSLVLDSNPFETFNFTNFPRMPELRSLDAKYLYDLRSIEEGAFGNMPNLKNLSLGMCPRLNNFSSKAFYVNDVGRFVPNHSINLTMLQLTGMNLEILNRELISNWSIPFINLQDNPWKCPPENDFLTYELFPQIKNKTPAWISNLYCVHHGSEFDFDPQGRKPYEEDQFNIAVVISVPICGLLLLALLIWCVIKACKRRRNRPGYTLLIL